MKKQTLQVLLALLIIGTGAISCSSKEDEKRQSKRYVKVKELGAKLNKEELTFHGELTEKKDVNVAFKVGGQILQVLVDEGDFVKKNQVIAQMDTRDYKINLQAAQAQYKQIEGEYARYKELYKKNKLPVNTLEKLEAGYLAAKSAFEAAQNALNDTQLKAPFAGFVYSKMANKYENVAPGQPIFSVLDVSHLEVHFSLPESKVALARNFKTITVDVANAQSYNMKAKLLSVNEKANGNDMFDVRLLVENEGNNAMKPGMSAKVRIEMLLAENEIVKVPVEAVFYKQNKAYVWVYNEQTSCVESRAVKIQKMENGGQLSVMSGLKGKEKIVVAGVHSLVNNQEVKILTKS